VTSERWLVAGLGNPPAEYAGTRHNVGAESVALLASDASRPLARNRRTGCSTAEVTLGRVAVVLAVPEGYMNLSGGPLQRAAGWYRIPLDRLVVCHDDLDLPLGAVRIKRGGSHGGHNGLRDIDRAFGSQDYLRVRIGIGRPPGSSDAADHVLRRFTSDEAATVATVLPEVGRAVTSLLTDGLEATQNRYHGRTAGRSEEDR
jgi:peptidyl-tRNA hydrolase, PTH1 family